MKRAVSCRALWLTRSKPAVPARMWMLFDPSSPSDSQIRQRCADYGRLKGNLCYSARSRVAPEGEGYQTV